MLSSEIERWNKKYDGYKNELANLKTSIEELHSELDRLDSQNKVLEDVRFHSIMINKGKCTLDSKVR
jgi:uncharacterized coiled-coil DUF342 family protein